MIRPAEGEIPMAAQTERFLGNRYRDTGSSGKVSGSPGAGTEVTEAVEGAGIDG